MKLFILSLVLYAVVTCVAYHSAKEEWASFKRKFHKRYASHEEERQRFLIFKSNLKKIEKHNRGYEAGLWTFMKGINEMSDLRLKEAKALRSCYIRGPNPEGVEYRSFNDAEPLPSSVDWREEGAVTDVKNQMKCGACYAFSAIGAIEGQHKIKTGQLVSLSEQFVIDCTWDAGNQGCHGGMPWEVFHSITNSPNGGVPTEDSYNYTGYDRGCHPEKAIIGATISGFKFVDDEGTKADVTKNLMEAVANVGPISVPITAGEDFFVYKAGVYNCTDFGHVNHGVLIVGYKTIGDTPVWIVKNSWGASWGDQGYIYVSTNKTSRCGFFESMVYPVID